jgi:hypothetical protein
VARVAIEDHDPDGRVLEEGPHERGVELQGMHRTVLSSGHPDRSEPPLDCATG